MMNEDDYLGAVLREMRAALAEQEPDSSLKATVRQPSGIHE